MAVNPSSHASSMPGQNTWPTSVTHAVIPHKIRLGTTKRAAR